MITAPYGLWGVTHGSEWNVRSATAVAVLGTFGTALAFVAMVRLSARVGATRASSLTYFEAIVALVLGAIVRDERIRPLELLGCAVLLLGAWLISRGDRAPVTIAVHQVDPDSPEAATTLVAT